MVNLSMAHADGTISNDLTESATKTSTKKSLRLSKKKELILNKKSEELQKKEKEEQQKNENEKKEKEEEHNAMELEEYDAESKGKQKRHWESWAKADKDLFFEAVSEFGKDFDKICSFMDKKVKTRGKSVKDCEPRNKDQIRYFYYRTWKQISKAVSLQPSESKRIHHEIYCMICYGELRKKFRGFGKKDLKKLDDLVRTGSTTVRHKGRKIRIKPPNCRFLKKLSDDEDKSAREQGAIPENIDVELYPRTNREWTMAQKLAFNPRIRLNGLPITLKVKSLMKLLLRRFDTLTNTETVVKLYPPKDLSIPQDSADLSSQVGGVHVSMHESTGSASTRLPHSTAQLSPLQHDSTGSGVNDNSGSKAVLNEVNMLQASLSLDNVTHSNTEPNVPQPPLNKVNEPPTPERDRPPLVNAAPVAVSMSTGSIIATPFGYRPAAVTVAGDGCIVSSMEDVSLASATPLIGAGVVSSQPSVGGNASGVQASTLGGNIVPLLPAISSAKSNIKISSLAETVATSTEQMTATVAKGSILGGNIANFTIPTADFVAGNDVLSTTSNTPASLKNQDKVSECNVVSVMSDAIAPAAKSQILSGEGGTTLSVNTLATNHATGKADARPVVFSNTQVPTADITTMYSTGCGNNVGEEVKNGKVKELPFFPISQDNCIDKDLQACCLALNRPDVIRLEYELEINDDKNKGPSISSFNKLVLLARRDLCKALKVATQQIKASTNTRISQMSRSVEVVKANQAVKPIYIATTFAEPQWVPLARQGLQEGLPIGSKPVVISASGLKSSVGIVPSLKNVKQPKAVPRLRPIQPASKTLMAKAVAVNIVPQPAQLAQFAQVPAVSTQLINSGSSSLSTVNLAVAETLSTQSTVAVTGSTFSVPSTSSLSSQLTIWGSSTTEPSSSPGVQVEVIQEGGRNKTYAKRLRPTTVISTEKPIKLQRLETSTLPKQSSDINDIDLSFLGNDDELKAKENEGRSASDSINLSSILSGLTKNLCQTSANEHGLVAAKSAAEALDKALPTSTASTSITQPQISPTDVTTFDKDPSRVSATSACSSVLTTPIKCNAKTPSKNDNSLDCYKIQPVNFDSQWFGEDMSEISIGGILDVGNLKDVSKSSDSSQVNELSIGALLNVPGEKKGQEASLSPSQVSDVSLGALLDSKDDNNRDKPQNTELSIGKLLDTLQRDESSKSEIPMVEPPKSCNSDSLLMKPDTDPVTVFESLMNENSVDYIRKFKDLTAKVKAEEALNKAQLSPTDEGTPDTERSLKNNVISNNSTSLNTKDPRLPIYTSEDSVGPLDDLSFVLPTSDTNSNDFP